MEKIIEVHWYNKYDDEIIAGDAIVEYTRYDEDGKIVNEIINIFLPEGIGESQQLFAKEMITRDFHNGEGYNL